MRGLAQQLMNRGMPKSVILGAFDIIDNGGSVDDAFDFIDREMSRLSNALDGEHLTTKKHADA
jgi:hypothetical protein